MRQHHGRGGGGVVADLALELLVGVAVPGGRHRDADRGEDLARLERGEVGALIEVARRDAALAALAGDADRSRRGTSSPPACRCRDRRWRRCRRACRRSAPAGRRSAARSRAGSGPCAASRSDAISSCWVVIAPMTMSPPSARMPLSSAMPARSTRWPGVARRSFIIGIRLCPPASGARVVAEIGEQGDRFLDGRRAMIGEGSRDHGIPPGAVRRAAASPRQRAAQFASLEACPVLAEACAAATTAGCTKCGRLTRTKCRRSLHEMRQRSADATSTDDWRDALRLVFEPIRDFSQPTRLRLTGTV